MSDARDSEPIYVDNAATTRLSERALEAMMPYLTEIYGNPSQPYSFSRATKVALRNARKTIAECINASPEEIVFTSGGTESDNSAIKGFALRGNRTKTIITTTIEHHAVLNSCKAMESLGHNVRFLSVNGEGIVQFDNLSAMPFNGETLVSCMFANNEIGTMQPISSLCAWAHAYGALFHTDAVQAVGHVPIDVKALDVDLLAASAHKFNGPRGIGFLYIKSGTDIDPYASGGGQEKGRRAGTENVAAIVGMAEALRENYEEMDVNQRRIKALESRLELKLHDYGIHYHRNGTAQLPGLLSFSFPNKNGEAILHRLDLMGICVSTGSACNGSRTEISHVLNAIGLQADLAGGTIRISIGKSNTTDEIDRIASSIKLIINGCT